MTELTDEELYRALGERAIALDWTWEVGSLTMDGTRILEVCTCEHKRCDETRVSLYGNVSWSEGSEVYSEHLTDFLKKNPIPNFRDPATRGNLLLFARTKLSCIVSPYVENSMVYGLTWRVLDEDGHDIPNIPSKIKYEAEALLCAVEAKRVG